MISFLSTSLYNVSYTNKYRRPDDGSQLQPKHVAVNKIDKIIAVWDWFDAYSWLKISRTVQVDLHHTP